jgi:hypothetical protein
VQAVGSPALRARHRWPQLTRILEGVLHSMNATSLVIFHHSMQALTGAPHPLQVMLGGTGGQRSSLQRVPISSTSTLRGFKQHSTGRQQHCR